MKTVTFLIDKRLHRKVDEFCAGVRFPKSLILNAAINHLLNMDEDERKKAIKRYTAPKSNR